MSTEDGSNKNNIDGNGTDKNSIDKEKTQKCNTNVYCPKFNHQFFCYFLFRNTVFLVFTLNIIYGRFLLYIL